MNRDVNILHLANVMGQSYSETVKSIKNGATVFPHGEAKPPSIMSASAVASVYSTHGLILCKPRGVNEQIRSIIN
jgi:hypothetical protein